MEFIETPIFTKLLSGLLADDQYHKLQVTLLFRPDAGAVIKGSGGLRKIRWAPVGSGKRGGLRVIYYHDEPYRIYMLFVYRKNERENLTPEQLKVLRTIIKEYLK
jgi:mRNA-degrading endonuclease RelE of RelBE toxin-antitoxin system